MRSHNVEIDSPCHESWDAMAGDSERRFCGVCDKHVHNLSAMRHDDAQALLQAASGQSLCVRYAADEHGHLQFRDLVPKSRLTRGLRRAAFAAVLLAACSPQGNEPAATLADAAVTTLREAAVPTPDGGCNVTTGPFTTFHFPPGHALCGPATSPNATTIAVPTPPPTTAQEPSVPAIAVSPPEPPHTPPPAPLPDPFPGVQTPEPQIAPFTPPPRMGRAIAQPERVDPFEPCDPPTKFAPPARVHPPKPPPPRMGAIAVQPPPMIQGGLKPVAPSPAPGFAPPPPPR